MKTVETCFNKEQARRIAVLPVESDTNVQIQEYVAAYITTLCRMCHASAVHAGWWNQPRDFGTLIALIHSEVSEAMEGGRKDATDEHLVGVPSVAVELADAVIRIADLAGALQIDLGKIVLAKMRYNAVRLDHKPEQRNDKGGKQF